MDAQSVLGDMANVVTVMGDEQGREFVNVERPVARRRHGVRSPVGVDQGAE